MPDLEQCFLSLSRPNTHRLWYHWYSTLGKEMACLWPQGSGPGAPAPQAQPNTPVTHVRETLAEEESPQIHVSSLS